MPGFLRCSVDLINADRDTMFGLRTPSPSRESLQDMEYIMKQGKYHIGIATDGDSDRIGLYDEEGNYIDANAILKLLYYYLVAYRAKREEWYVTSPPAMFWIGSPILSANRPTKYLWALSISPRRWTKRTCSLGVKAAED